MADPEAVILSAIERLDGWLLKKRGIIEENSLEKLCSLIVGMSDLGEEKKEMVHSLWLQLGPGKDRYVQQQNMEKLYNLLDMNKEKMFSLVVGMADFLEDYKLKLYNFLFWVAEGGSEGELNQEKENRLLVEITDLWGDDEGELDKEKLRHLLPQILDRAVCYSKKKMIDKVAELWKDKQPKLNKEKLHTWLANKVDCYSAWQQNQYPLFGTLHRIVLDSLHLDQLIRERVDSLEEAREEFRMILDLIRDKKLGKESGLRYFISDIVDMAHRAHSLIHLKDSDPFALFFFQVFLIEEYPKWFRKKFEHIVKVLQEIKDGMLGSGVERLQNVREMEGGEDVVGLEEDIEFLLSDEANQAHTLIKGMAGIGKTTLARQLYNHPTITQQFERRAWVCLSTVFSRKEMLVSLIRQMADGNELASLENIECADYETLKQVLHQQWLGIRYFIVLDDVWKDTTHFNYIKKALPREDEQISRLLFTSRTMQRDYYNEVKYHKMTSMDDDKSWRLLLKTLSIEGIGEEFPKPLVKKARQILMRKCGGLPLAIKEVGRNWAKKRQSGSEWEELIESIDLSETLGALEQSYHNWHEKIQSCFLHLAFFKEGATITARKLVQIWGINGVISESDGMSILEDLSEETIFDVIGKGKDGCIKKCCIQPIFHMLSIIKAKDELNFEIISKDGNNRPSHQPHHRAMYCSREKLMNYSSNQDTHLVSLFLYGGGYFNSSPSYWKNFEQLETLDMEDFGLKILPGEIGMLTKLRYLGLRNNYIQELPHSLSRLKNLEVLDVALNFMVEVEDIIWEMESLRHLYMSDISCRKPLRIDTLMNLETLMYISVHNWTYEVSRLYEMRHLTKLGIQEVDGNTDLSALFESLNWRNVTFLIIKGFCFKSMSFLDMIGILGLHELKLDGRITKLPSDDNFLPNIMRLSLVNSCLHEDPMPKLEKLSNLTYLKLQNAYTGQQMVIPGNGFLNLEFLVIEELWHLTNVQIGKGAMQELKELEINNCPYLDTLPEDYFPGDDMMFKMKTTKKNATKIRESSFVSRIKKVEIQP